jgi:hypothetical protein
MDRLKASTRKERNMATVWDYIVVHTTYDYRINRWYANITGHGRIYDLDAICKYYGGTGWELVSTSALVEEGKWGKRISTDTIILFFKRPQ